MRAAEGFAGFAKQAKSAWRDCLLHFLLDFYTVLTYTPPH
jgi:hypothetical protein